MTDPSPEFPLGRTPADFASVNGQKGISGFLAESSLTSYLSSLTVNEPKSDDAAENSGTKAFQTVSERTATPVNYFDMPDTLSLKDSLTAVRNATQAADRIHLMFRMQSFERRQLDNYDNDEFGFSDEHALSLLAAKTSKAGPSYGQANAAAVHIQKKFRGWKKRKEFLIIRQRIVKIQVHATFFFLISKGFFLFFLLKSAFDTPSIFQYKLSLEKKGKKIKKNYQYVV